MLRLIGLIVLATLASTPTEAAPPLRVMSFNIRYGSAKDGENSWNLRHDFVADTIQSFDPDLFGTQETLGFQRDFLAAKFPGYTAIGVGRDDGGEKGEMMAIFIRKERFEIRESGHFWLSETPDVAGSKSWDSSLPRMVTWVELKDKKAPDSPVLRWMNTHFDHIGVEARKQAARLIRERVQAAGDKAVLVTGDFNSIEGSDAYRNLFGAFEGRESPLIDTFRALPKDKQRFDDVATFSNFKGGGARKGGRIDWIGVTGQLRVLSSEIDYTERNGRTPSDHFPVTAVIEWKP
ncbi:MAG TPA: endonuclease/exonuclease/phosphatase family protein [Planctomycetaceae bacterium]|nr:endonuclease/exonuclease/phosphatase family protein [Planctomycetaceae bacterium]